MALKNIFLTLLFLTVSSTALLVYAPQTPALILITLMIVSFLAHAMFKPTRRCKSCGDIVTLAPVSYIKLRLGSLSCQRCGTTM